MVFEIWCQLLTTLSLGSKYFDDVELIDVADKFQVRRQCLNELEKEYCMKTKLIALD